MKQLKENRQYPEFYKNVGSGNELSNQLTNNGTSSEVTLSYGVKFAYKISKKLKIRTGISKVDINNKIQDIAYSPSAASSQLENIGPSVDNLDIRDNSPSENGFITSPTSENTSLTASIFVLKLVLLIFVASPRSVF